jgi:hypothetical protein
VAVTGRGPRGDSHGSGKTTFLGAVSLLLGDIGWRPAAGAPEAASLLFDGTKAGVDVERYARAERGYVIGVFAREGGVEPLTVWLRINATSQYLWARCTDGIRLVDQATPSAREAVADSIWSELPDPQWGSRTYVEKLYGSAPRCVAWLQARGNATPGKSLLKLAQERMEPEQVGLALLELVGRDDLIDADAEARADLDERTRELERLRLDDGRRRQEEDDELAAIAARQKAREQLALANSLWRLHYAKGLLDASARAAAARGEVAPLGGQRRLARGRLRAASAELALLGDGSALRGAADQASALEQAARETHETALRGTAGLRATLDQLERAADERRPLAERWDGTSLQDADSAVAAASEHERDTIARLGAAEAGTAEADRSLAAVESHGGGRAGQTAARLDAAGLHTRALLDELRLDPDARGDWEPRLTLYEDAVAVGNQFRREALAAAEPGDVLVFGSETSREPPPGIAAAPPAAIDFLYEIADAPAHHDPARAELGAHVVVVGGFADPVIGRAARLDAVQRKIEQSHEQEQEARNALSQAIRRREIAQATRNAAQAHSDLTEATKQSENTRRHLHDAAVVENSTASDYAEARERSGLAQREWGGFEASRTRVEAEIRAAEEELAGHTGDLRAALERVRRRTEAIGYWSRAWAAGGTTSAEAALADDTSGEARADADAYRRAANHALDRALAACGIESDTGAGAPPGSGVAIAVSERTNADRSDSAIAGSEDISEIRYERLARAFHALVEALGSWLQRLQLEDEAAEAHIVADRDRRDEALTIAAAACAARSRNLPILQDQIERVVRTLLAEISDRLNELDLAARGSGADLRIESLRPATAKEPWQWRVTPRYRRGPGGPLVPYLERANTATEKLLAIHLVLAALFAATHGRDGAAGRVLILDELGDSLGDYHRDAVLRALAETAAGVGLTVLGTCQDGVLEDAARHAGLVLYFQFRDLSDILNAPTRAFGVAGDGLVELTGSHIERLT